MDEKIEVKEVRKTSKVKRNVTIMVVVLCICAAAYLNWSYNNQSGADTVLSDATLAGAKTSEETLATQGDYISEYFAQARLTRQQSRDEALYLLEVAAASENASQETINGAMTAISAMATYSMQETQIENLVLAKGFQDCVVFMSSDRITIAVPAPDEGLAADQVAKITDAILSETSYAATQINIIEVKKPSSEPVQPSPELESGETDSETIGTDDLATQGGYIEDGAEIFE